MDNCRQITKLYFGLENSIFLTMTNVLHTNKSMYRFDGEYVMKSINKCIGLEETV